MKMLERQMMLRKHRNQIQSASARAFIEAQAAIQENFGSAGTARAAWRATYRAEVVCDHYYYEAYNLRANTLEHRS